MNPERSIVRLKSDCAGIGFRVLIFNQCAIQTIYKQISGIIVWFQIQGIDDMFVDDAVMRGTDAVAEGVLSPEPGSSGWLWPSS